MALVSLGLRLSLNEYPGEINTDGAQAIVDCIHDFPQPLLLIGIDPLTSTAEALRLDPSIANNTRFIGMLGGVRKGYGGSRIVICQNIMLNKTLMLVEKYLRHLGTLPSLPSILAVWWF